MSTISIKYLDKLNNIKNRYSIPYTQKNMKEEHYVELMYEELSIEMIKEIERLNKQLQLISDEFLKYDWENSSKKQIINQLKSLYNSIFKGSDKE